MDELSAFISEVRRCAATETDAPSVLRSAKYFFPWSRNLTRTALQEHLPWINFAALRYLSRLPLEQFSVFEFGAGGSTLYFLSRAKQLVTVEHDLDWLRQVRVKASALRKASPWVALHAPAAASPTQDPLDPADPTQFRSSTGECFREYACTIQRYPDASFDLILVDGRARPSCLMESLSKARAGGLIVLDNSERPHYQQALQHAKRRGLVELSFFAPGPFTARFWKTTFLMVPGSDIG